MGGIYSSLFYLGWIRGKDTSRLLHYEGGGSRTPSTDIVCPMYMRVWDIVKIAKDPNELRPLILCEYVHFLFAQISFCFSFLLVVLTFLNNTVKFLW